jgi:hypothetical protein
MADKKVGFKTVKEKVEEVLPQQKDGVLDRILSRVTSRKLLVWLTGSALLYTGGLQSNDWVAISLVYIGSQAAVDLAVAWKKA